jgi:hypothetical protein
MDIRRHREGEEDGECYGDGDGRGMEMRRSMNAFCTVKCTLYKMRCQQKK